MEKKTAPVWEWESDKGWVAFDQVSQSQLEFMYDLDPKNGVQALIIGENSFKITFNDMKQTNTTTSKQVSVRRNVDGKSTFEKKDTTTKQWVKAIVNKSSEVSKFPAKNIIGATKHYPKYGVQKTNWQPDVKKDPKPYLELEFEHILIPTCIRIYETLNPGCCVNVSARNENKEWISLWKGSTVECKPKSVVLNVPVESAPFPTKFIRLDFECKQPYQVEAVMLCGQWAKGTVPLVINPNWASWYLDKTFSDLVLECKDGTVYAHKVVLASGSETLLKMISNETMIKVDYGVKSICKVLKFLYAGRVDFDLDSINELITIGDRWGMIEFNKQCFEFMGKSMDTKNVILMLVKAQNKEFDFDVKYLIQNCYDQICQRAHQVFASDLMYLIDGQVMKQLVSSDKLCIDEYELFEHLIIWAKKRSEMDKMEEDMILEPLFKLIRWPLMDSGTLFYKIKPIQEKNNWKWLTQEDYVSSLEYNLDPLLFVNDKNIMFKGRASTAFSASTIVESAQAQLISSWLPKGIGKKIKMIYSHADGLTAGDFHRLCDNKGPTVIIIRSTLGNVFGAYCPVAWSCVNGYINTDTESFLFSLVNTLGVDACKMNLLPGKKGMYGHASYGPYLGKGDLVLGANFTISNSCKPFSYNYPPKARKVDFLGGGNTFVVEKIEVFSISK